MDKLFQYHDDSTIKYDFNPTFILPPYRGRILKKGNPSQGEEVRYKLIFAPRGRN